MTDLQWVVTFTFLSVLLVSGWATKTQEIEDNKISIRFDKVDLSEWNNDEDDPTGKFQIVVAESVSSHCSTQGCVHGKSSTPFREDDIVILEGYPADENADVQIVFYVSIVDQDKPEDGNQYALKKNDLETVLKDSRTAINNATGYDVVFIGDERVSAFLDPTMNTIMIPVAIATLILLVLITCCLHFREKRNDKAHGLVIGTRADVPSNDAHGEGVVLTAINKNSVKPQDPNSNRNDEENPTA